MKIPVDRQEVTCPACSSKTLCRTISSVAEGTTELKELFVGTLNKATCMSCSTQFLIEIPLIYRDNDKRFLIYYSPLTGKDQIEDIIGSVEELYHQVFDNLETEDKPQFRVTLCRKDFIEKIAIHQKDYDDRLIEYIKYQLFQHSTQGLDPYRMDLLFDFSNSTKECLRFLAFDRKTGKPVYSLDFTLKDYNHLENYFFKDPEMEARLNQFYQKHYVHVSNIL